MTVVTMNCQFHSLKSFDTWLFFAQQEGLHGVAFSGVGEVKQWSQGFPLQAGQGQLMRGGVDVAVRGEEAGDVFDGDCGDKDRWGKLHNYHSIAATERPALSWRWARLKYGPVIV